MDDWRVRLAFPFFMLIDFLLSRQRIARYLFDNFRTKDNLKSVLSVRPLLQHIYPLSWAHQSLPNSTHFAEEQTCLSMCRECT